MHGIRDPITLISETDEIDLTCRLIKTADSTKQKLAKKSWTCAHACESQINMKCSVSNPGIWNKVLYDLYA